MPLPTKPCKYCESLSHWPYQCRFSKKNMRPQKPKLAIKRAKPFRFVPIKKVGKQTAKWYKTRTKWFKEHPSDYYTCYLQISPLCPKVMPPEETTLDHIIPRSRAPHLRYEFSNLKPCCGPCNTEKGSRVLT